jgi:hypothetical protein
MSVVRSPFYIEFPVFAQHIGSPLHGFIGNTRFDQYGGIRVFYFMIPTQIGYYTIIITVLPNGLLARNMDAESIQSMVMSDDPRLNQRKCDELYIISEICGAFYTKNRSSLFSDRETSDETNSMFRKLVNHQLDYMKKHNPDPFKTAYGAKVKNESILSAIVMDQYDTAEIHRLKEESSVSGRFNPKNFQRSLNRISQNGLAMVYLEDREPASTVRYISTPANGFEDVPERVPDVAAAATSSPKKTGKNKTVKEKTPEKKTASASGYATQASGKSSATTSGSKKKKAGGRKSRSYKK